ncbi:hypothetical protein OEW28_17530 [Defluviimonas sp. WL0002]|uniref:ATP-grasp domain-containing protein n=1 Tax=Albidovulum marisflavi TaxID=2984159 RepID=A0ABT2ZGZ8_9RHOB|nr:hypothetical protein [Defluviimonas sp. WL0002]MCV2870418.1 hypothetical protein [Defluviimonas sp. WL0002]
MTIQGGKGRGLVFESVPENGHVRVRIDESGKPKYLWPNRTLLSDEALDKLRKRGTFFFYPPPRPVEQRGLSWIVNICADADEYRGGLLGLDAAFGTALPIFNHPRAVAMTRRDLSAARLDGIEGLIVPRCRRFMADETDSFQKAFKEGEFRYPVLVRPAASQTGRDLVRIDTPFDWPKVYQTHWYGKPHFMTQFHDTYGPEGFLKLRAGWFGGRMQIHSIKQSQHWRVNHETGETPPDIFAPREAELVDKLLAEGVLASVMEQIGSLSGMDLIGADLGILPDGRLVLFEANAAMTMIQPLSYFKTTIAKDRFRRLHGPVREAVNAAVDDFLAQVAKGERGPSATLPSVAETFDRAP